jgi:hypothetical protein
MSLFDYQASKQIAQMDPPFAALIMAAYRKADTSNAIHLEQAFPAICRELRARYNAPGGLLDGEQVSA